MEYDPDLDAPSGNPDDTIEAERRLNDRYLELYGHEFPENMHWTRGDVDNEEQSYNTYQRHRRTNPDLPPYEVQLPINEDGDDQDAVNEVADVIDQDRVRQHRGNVCNYQFFRTAALRSDQKPTYFLYQDVKEVFSELGADFPGCSNISDDDTISMEPIRELVDKEQVIVQFTLGGKFIRCWDIGNLAVVVATAAIACEIPVNPLTREEFTMDDIAMIGLAFCVVYIGTADTDRMAMSAENRRHLETIYETMKDKWDKYNMSRADRDRVKENLQNPYPFFSGLMGESKQAPPEFPNSLNSIKPFADMINKDMYFRILRENVETYIKIKNEAEGEEQSNKRRRQKEIRSYRRKTNR
jgi:hypothetical protein